SYGGAEFQKNDCVEGEPGRSEAQRVVIRASAEGNPSTLCMVGKLREFQVGLTFLLRRVCGGRSRSRSGRGSCPFRFRRRRRRGARHSCGAAEACRLKLHLSLCGAEQGFPPAAIG